MCLQYEAWQENLQRHWVRDNNTYLYHYVSTYVFRCKKLGKTTYGDSGLDEFEETDEDPLAHAIETK